MSIDRLMIRYRVHPKDLETNLSLVRAVYDELEAVRPPGLAYATFQLEDGLSFVDVALGPDLPGPLPGLRSFRDFRAGHEARCQERLTDEFNVIGTYGMLP